MVKKLSIIGFILIAFLTLAAKPSFAAGHAYGQDKHEDKIVLTTNIQGKSTSDPDNNGKGPDRSNGGYDKPGFTGGINSDRDGNNGCGNDTDREDDNEGWCGLKPKQTKVENNCEQNCEPKEEHNGCDNNCKQNCSPETNPEEKPEPTPTTPEVTATTEEPSHPQVLGLTTLPDTAAPVDYSIYWVVLLLLSGVELHLLANKVQ